MELSDDPMLQVFSQNGTFLEVVGTDLILQHHADTLHCERRLAVVKVFGDTFA